VNDFFGMQADHPVGNFSHGREHGRPYRFVRKRQPLGKHAICNGWLYYPLGLQRMNLQTHGFSTDGLTTDGFSTDEFTNAWIFNGWIYNGWIFNRWIYKRMHL
jgi:hypothetical protein